MLKYLAKISLDIFPSVLATIIGAYIVNHYINAKPAPDAPAAAVSSAQAKKDTKPADVANLPSPGVKAKGIPEKAVSERAAEVKPAEPKSTETKSTETKSSETKSTETKSAETRPAETAPAETVANPHVHQPASREKAVAKVTAPQAAPAVESSSAPATQTQEANDLARAAIERLRKSPQAPQETTRPQETARAPEAPRVQEAPQVATAVRPLPPPITVSTPGSETYGAPPESTASVGNDDRNRLTPPADIPVPVLAPPLDLRADAASPMAPRAKTNVAEDMLSGVKSMFHAVLPKPISQD